MSRSAVLSASRTCLVAAVSFLRSCTALRDAALAVTALLPAFTRACTTATQSEGVYVLPPRTRGGRLAWFFCRPARSLVSRSSCVVFADDMMDVPIPFQTSRTPTIGMDFGRGDPSNRRPWWSPLLNLGAFTG